jgi:hypothetical protein
VPGDGGFQIQQTAYVCNSTTSSGNNFFTVGGTVAGLVAGDTVVLQRNGFEPITVGANGAFVFPTPQTNGSSYEVTVMAQPAHQTCSIASPAGTVASANVTSVTVTCVGVHVGGTLIGLADGASVVLQNNGGDNLTLTGKGTSPRCLFPARSCWRRVSGARRGSP